MTALVAMPPRQKEFDDKLVALIGEYLDVPKGARGFILFMSFVALLSAEKGGQLTGKELVEMCSLFATKMHGAGLVKL